MEGEQICLANASIAEIWCDQLLSMQFNYELWAKEKTVQTSMGAITNLAIIIYLFTSGSIQQLNYYRYETKINLDDLKKSRLYTLQRALHYFVILVILMLFIFQAIVLNNGNIYVFMTATTISTILAYLFCLHLMNQERHYFRPTDDDDTKNIPPDNHRIALLGFWVFSLIIKYLDYLDQSKGFLQFNTLNNGIETMLSVAYCSTLSLILILGCLAPGIGVNMTAKKRYEEDMKESNNNVQLRYQWKHIWIDTKKIFSLLHVKCSTRLCYSVIALVGFIFIGRVINIYAPMYNKKVIDSISKPGEFRWDFMLTFVVFKFFESGDIGIGILEELQYLMWFNLEEYIQQEVKTELFQHIHSLSLKYHLSRKTGDVINIMEKSHNHVISLMRSMFMTTIPALIDLVAGFIFLTNSLNKWYIIVIILTMLMYLVLMEFVETLTFGDHSEENTTEQTARSIDSLLNFETVKYFNNEAYEIHRFQKTIKKPERYSWKKILVSSVQSMMTSGVMSCGFFVVSLLSLHSVISEKDQTAGDYVLFASYINRLFSPVHQLMYVKYYMLSDLKSLDNTFILLNEKPDVMDAPDAKQLKFDDGHIEFSNVSFGYLEGKTTLKNISFTVGAGKTVALVGHSGAGKSTIMRLIFRFYEPTKGDIFIDGQNIKKVTQTSLRNAIGVVPQDTVLFNDTLKYNIEYGKIGATDEEIETAAKHADIHDRILTFPDGYETQVGERGLRLSGGEKQRIAIARTILKAPKIVILDEATSSLDTRTERNIQAALDHVCENRTTLIVAHRLSTIIHADEILVLKEGEIIERGRHEELLAANGSYRDMWDAQFAADKDTDKLGESTSSGSESSTDGVP